MTNRGGQRTYWRFFEGATSVSGSMWVAIALNQCNICSGWPLFGFLSALAATPTGVIIVATALLFPTTALLYGSSLMILAAIDTYEKLTKARVEKAEAKAREEGLAEGREVERQRIAKLLEQHGIPLPPEVVEGLNADPE